MAVSQLLAQTKTVTGKVVDDKGASIAGATILEKGTRNGVSAGSDGAFTIKVKAGATLVISAIGFEDKVVSSANAGTIQLTTDTKSLSEVVVTGVAAATSRKNLTISVTKVNEDRLSATPAVSMSSALVGKVAGVQSSSPSGAPGQSLDLQLRADNNLNNVGSGPLIVIDGVILNGSLSDINADDVESMEVVKGAAAASLYGSRAGNGVIAITTKRGSKLGFNTSKITVRNEIGFQNIAKKLNLATHHPYTLASDWQQFAGKFTKYAGITYPSGYTGGGYNPGIAGNRALDADHYMDNPYGVTRDQQSDFFKTGTNFTNFISIASRSAKSNLYLSFENNSQEGIVIYTNGYKRQNFRLNIDHQIASWLKVSASNLFINTNTNYPGSTGSFFNIALASPDVDLNASNPDGQPYYLRMDQFSNNTNPIYPLWKLQRDDKTRRWIGNYSANVKFSSWANLDLSQSIEIENYRYTAYNPKDTWNPTGGTSATNGMAYTNGSLRKYSEESSTQNTQATLNLQKKFGNLDVNGRLSYLYEDRYYENYEASASQLVYPDIPRFANFKTINAGDSRIEQEKAQNYFAIASLNWKNKYLVDGMYRYDGSSLFGPDARWNSYYRVSGAYRISEEIKIPHIDELKVRAAYGTAGIRPGFSWQYETFSLSNGVATAKQKGNSNLKPSKTSETEFGLNVEFLKKFTFEAVYASSVTDNQFINVPLIPFLNDGYNQQYQNAGVVKSNTLELSLGANWIKKKNFAWSSNIVFSKINQKITSLPVAPYLFGSTDGGGGQMFYIKEGENYGVMYGYSWVTSLEQMAKQLPSGKTISDYELNSDGYVIAKGTQGTISELPIKLQDGSGNLLYGKIGDGNAKFRLGFANTLSYKGFSLYFLIDVKAGGDVYNSKSQWITRDYRNGIMDMSNVASGSKKAYDYYIGFYDVNSVNKYWVENAGYAKLRELSIGYSFPSASLSKVFKGVVKGINIKAIGRNLLTVTKYTGYDPEVGSLREPYDGTNKYPNYRNFAFSLSFEF